MITVSLRLFSESDSRPARQRLDWLSGVGGVPPPLAPPPLGGGGVTAEGAEGAGMIIVSLRLFLEPDSRPALQRLCSLGVFAAPDSRPVLGSILLRHLPAGQEIGQIGND